MASITIKHVPEHIADRIREKGVSRSGNDYLLVAYILDQAEIIPDLIRSYDKCDKEDQISLLDAIEKAVEIGRIFAGSVSPKKQIEVTQEKSAVITEDIPQEEDQDFTFGAGK